MKLSTVFLVASSLAFVYAALNWRVFLYTAYPYQSPTLVFSRELLAPDFEFIEPARNTSVGVANTSETFYLSILQNAGLGNRLFQFASAYGVARTVGKRLHIAESGSGSGLLDVFPGIRKVAFVTRNGTEVANKTATFVKDPKHCAFVSSVVEQSRTPCNVVLSGYFQSWRYFDRYRGEILELLRFNVSIREKTDRFMLAIKDKALVSLGVPAGNVNLTWIAVHNRRGDYLSHYVSSIGFRVATPQYFEKAAGYFTGKYRGRHHGHGLVFLVFSNDQNWTKSHFKINRDSLQSPDAPGVHVEFVSTGDRDLDFSLMTRCNATIMSVGTFGWWAAYLTGGETIYYAYPYKAGSQYARRFSIGDHYPPNWIKMS